METLVATDIRMTISIFVIDLIKNLFTTKQKFIVV